MAILRARPGQEVKLGEKVYTANEHGLVLVQADEAQILRAHGFLPVLNTNEVRDPLPTDDGNSGHGIGSHWNNRVAQTSFVCLDSSPLKAVWKNVASRDDAFALLKIELPPAESPATPEGGKAEDDADQSSAAISDPTADGGGLIGSNKAPSLFELEDGNTVQLGLVVAEAHKRSGLSVADWNSLNDDERDLQINLVAEELPLKKNGTAIIDPPLEGAGSEGVATDTTAQTDSSQAEEQGGGQAEEKPADTAPLAPADETKPAEVDKTLEERLLNAGLDLNHDEDAHWTKDGLPNVNVLAEKVSAHLTRALVTAVLGEDFKRKTK